MTRKYAADDAELNRASLITSRSRVYSDLDSYFEANPSSNDVYLSRDAAAVKQSIRNLIMTNHYEKPFKPFVGGNTRAHLFKNIQGATLAMIDAEIRSAIDTHEKRAKVLRLTITPVRDNALDLSIEFQVISTKEIASIAIQLRRLR